MKAFDVGGDVITALEGGKCSRDSDGSTEFTGILFHWNEVMAYDGQYRTDAATCIEAAQGGITYSVFEVLFLDGGAARFTSSALLENVTTYNSFMVIAFELGDNTLDITLAQEVTWTDAANENQMRVEVFK